MGACADGQFFSKFFFTPFVYVLNDQRVMGIILRYVPPPPPGDPGG